MRDDDRPPGDLDAGLIGLTRAQMMYLRQWCIAEKSRAILAVGDILPLAMSWWCGRRNNSATATRRDPVPFAFVGCAKSEFYWKRPSGDSLPGYGAGSTIYNPIERYLLSSSSCKTVFPRDELTSVCLAEAMNGCGHKVTLELDHFFFFQFWTYTRKGRMSAVSVSLFWDQVKYAGNPMMDGLDEVSQPLKEALPRCGACAVLLPGTRSEESSRNLTRALNAVKMGAESGESGADGLLVLLPIPDTITKSSVVSTVEECGFRLLHDREDSRPDFAVMSADLPTAARSGNQCCCVFFLFEMNAHSIITLAEERGVLC